MMEAWDQYTGGDQDVTLPVLIVGNERPYVESLYRDGTDAFIASTKSLSVSHCCVVIRSIAAAIYTVALLTCTLNSPLSMPFTAPVALLPASLRTRATTPRSFSRCTL